MKDIKDYIHLYIGHRAKCIGKSGVKYIGDINPFLLLALADYEMHEVKPILRPLSDMTDEEDREAGRVYRTSLQPENRYVDEAMAAKLAYLLSRGFDLFGLIEAGLAIDKTKLA